LLLANGADVNLADRVSRASPALCFVSRING